MVEERLPLLDYVDNLFQHVGLEDTLVLACQHILETNYLMFEYLFRHGLKPKNTFLIGKCYSTNKAVLNKFKKRGVNVHNGSIKYESHRSFDEQFEEQVIDFVNKINKVDLDSYERIIIIDDGGYLVYWANDFLKNKKSVVAIEQTSSGYVKLKNLRLKFPVINVARSEAKINLESPFIAETVLLKIQERLLRLKISPKNVLVVGNGAIGKEVSRKLIGQFKVSHYDLNHDLSDLKEINSTSVLSRFDMIIGCTGEQAIRKEQFNLLKKGTILVSASSSDREFSASQLRKLVPKNRDCHRDLKINNLILLNSGFPINFDGSPNSVSPEKIQLTRALILSAVYLAKINNYTRELIPLDKRIQTSLAEVFSELARRRKIYKL